MTLGNGTDPGEVLVHDERADRTTLAHLLSLLTYPDYPEAVGVFRCVSRPTHDEMLDRQIADAVALRGGATLDELFAADDTWEVS